MEIYGKRKRRFYVPNSGYGILEAVLCVLNIAFTKWLPADFLFSFDSPATFGFFKVCS